MVTYKIVDNQEGAMVVYVSHDDEKTWQVTNIDYNSMDSVGINVDDFVITFKKPNKK